MIDIKQLPLGPLQTNCYFLGCQTTKRAAIIDPAWDGHAIANMVQKDGYTVTHILLTHSHFDHIGGLAHLKEDTDAPIYAHEKAVPFIEMGAQIARRWGLTMPETPPVDHTIAEGDTIAVGNVSLEVLFTPGHAPGHVCFYLREYDVLFDGDVLFQGSIGRTDLPGGDFTTLMDSIEQKLLPLPDNTQLLSGHGPVTTIGAERHTNPFLQ